MLAMTIGGGGADGPCCKVVVCIIIMPPQDDRYALSGSTMSSRLFSRHSKGRNGRNPLRMSNFPSPRVFIPKCGGSRPAKHAAPIFAQSC